MLNPITITRYNCRCERCGYEWQTNADAVPKVCGRCKSQRWNEAKKERSVKDETVRSDR